MTVEVLPDVTGIDRTFHYDASGQYGAPGRYSASGQHSASGQPRTLQLGSIVRVVLHGRRVRGWVVGIDTPVPEGVELQPLLEVISAGPPPDVVALCRWVAWRFAGRLRAPLVAASPERIVRSLPPGDALLPADPSTGVAVPAIAAAVESALAAGDAVLRLPPAEERLPVVQAALEFGPRGPALVLCESRSDVERLAGGLRRHGWSVAVHPEEWGRAARVTVGTRNAVFTPLDPVMTVVLDAHSEAYRAERVPTFDARAVAAERGRRIGSPVVFVTPCPTVELLEAAARPGGRALVTVPHQLERDGWGRVGVLDVREEDPAEGGYPSRLVSWIREAAVEGRERPVVCIVNRTGRARLLRCGMCKSLQRCPRCGGAQVMVERPPKGQIGTLTCPRCGAAEPAICPSCGSARLQIARAGVSRAREQLEAVTGLAVGEVSGPRAPVPEAPVLIGTQAVLHRVRSASLVVWLDFDQELLAPRFRAAEEALAFLARSVRLVGGRRRGGRVVVRTSLPDHEVVRAVQVGDPSLVEVAERERRQLLSLPPFSVLARVEGPGAAGFVESVVELEPGVAALPAGDEELVLRAVDASVLADGIRKAVDGLGGGYAALDARVEMEPIDV